MDKIGRQLDSSDVLYSYLMNERSWLQGVALEWEAVGLPVEQWSARLTQLYDVWGQLHAFGFVSKLPPEIEERFEDERSIDSIGQ